MRSRSWALALGALGALGEELRLTAAVPGVVPDDPRPADQHELVGEAGEVLRVRDPGQVQDDERDDATMTAPAIASGRLAYADTE